MVWPVGVQLRQLRVPQAWILEHGLELGYRIRVKASRSLVRISDGYRLQSVFVLRRGYNDDEEDLLFPLPATDMSGWKDSETNQEILITGSNQYTHTYTACVQFVNGSGRTVGEEFEIGPFIMPFNYAGNIPLPDPGINLYTMIDAGSTEGEQILIPPEWGGLIDQVLPPRIKPDTDETVLDDFDVVTESGWYRSKSGTLNAPRPGTLWYTSFISGEDGMDGVQVAHGYDGSYKNLAFVRSKIDGVWGSWASLGSAAGSYPLVEDTDDEGTYLITSPNDVIEDVNDPGTFVVVSNGV